MSVPTITFLKESDLLAKAAASEKMVLREKPREYCYPPAYDSKEVGTFRLSKDFLAVLEKNGFTFEPGREPPHDTMIYLVGHSHQTSKEIWETDCWAWERTHTGPHELTVYFRLQVVEEDRGVVCVPHVDGNWSGGACHRPTVDKVVRVIAEHFHDAHPLIKAMNDSDTHPVIYWSNIGLGGIKSVGRLFHEFFGRNEKIGDLAKSRLSPFDPIPNPQRMGFEVVDRLFVLEVDQTKLFRQWKEQLANLRNQLV